MPRRHEYSLVLADFELGPAAASVVQLELRAPEPADAPEIAELMIDAYRGTFDGEGETLDTAVAEVRGYLGGGSGGPPLLPVSRLAFVGTRLVGACLVSDWSVRRVPLIAYVMTHSEWKQRGVGKQVLGAVLQALGAQGHPEVRAVITEGNSASERLFGQMGFRISDPNTDVRPFQERDEAPLVALWHRSGQAAYHFLPTWQAFTRERATEVFREVIRPRCDIWVGTREERVVAFLAMCGSYVDRMYVDPSEWRKGWGTRLVLLAKALHPEGLELHTHQENHAARQLYEKQGFRVVKLGVSPPPESAPDVEYHWRPDSG